MRGRSRHFAAGIAALLPLAIAGGDDGASMREEIDRLRDLLWKSAEGKTYESVESRDGEVFRDVVVTSVRDGAVAFRHDGGRSELDFDECPEDWIKSFDLTPPGDAPGAKPGQYGEPDALAASAIVVISGDRGTGTGFFIRHGGTTWLYTAAHVLSGNSKLQVKRRDGELVAKFGAFEAAEGADMARLEVLEDVPHALRLAPSRGSAAVDVTVYASGNAGGGGTVGFEAGSILGVGPESIEIDAQVIQGNSGGPVFDGRDGTVIGLVTHLTAARKDLWAEETRFAEVRRFACRLDREWDWKRMPIDAFLQEGRQLARIRLASEIMRAALQPDQWSGGVLVENRDDPLAREIMALSRWIDDQRKGGQRFSEVDRKKRLRTILQSALHRSRAEMSGMKPDGFAWFHRQVAEETAKDRELIDKAFLESAEAMR